MTYGVAGYAIVRDTEAEAQRELERITDVQQSARGYQNYQQWVTGSKLEQKISLEDYSVSNRGLRSGLVGTPAAGEGAYCRFSRCRSGSVAAAVQPAARGDGALCRSR